MLYAGKSIRLKRLFKGDGKAFIVALDHGVVGITDGMENLNKMIDTVIRAGADAVMVNIGIVKYISETIAGRTALVATTEYAEESLIEAMKFDACAVKTTYFGDVPPEEAIRERFRHIALKCNEWGMPYMAECVPAKPSGEYIFDADLIQKAARVSAELGADIVKTAYPGTMDGFKKAIEACPAPIVIAGGPRIESDRDALKMVKESVEAGGAGVAIGRNIWQHKHPSKMTEAIAKIIHEDISVEEALKILK